MTLRCSVSGSLWLFASFRFGSFGLVWFGLVWCGVVWLMTSVQGQVVEKRPMITTITMTEGDLDSLDNGGDGFARACVRKGRMSGRSDMFFSSVDLPKKVRLVLIFEKQVSESAPTRLTATVGLYELKRYINDDLSLGP